MDILLIELARKPIRGLIEEHIVLHVNLKASEQQVAAFIAGLCTKFGNVLSVKVHWSPTPFAMIEMLNQAQTQALAWGCGGAAFGTTALVHLAQQS